MNWDKYFKETDCYKRYDMLQKNNRLSYDHVDDWLFSLKYFLELNLKDILNELSENSRLEIEKILLHRKNIQSQQEEVQHASPQGESIPADTLEVLGEKDEK